ncbi:phosphoenolpyruvate hydrolase family protein [Streptomyces sp. NPDC004549]|uniref:phosphoenolpyruvate hydrolase family protein n=1 Tax=Streptomyces sp. NPDC004549 TaxID=3154283 RepID=UPI0033BE27C4
MAEFDKGELLGRLREKAARGEPLIGGGAGSGVSAKSQVAGGVDLVLLYNSGRFRTAGHGSLAGLLAYGNANETVLELAREIMPVVPGTPVIAGLNGTDPLYGHAHLLAELDRLGVVGVQNFPTVGLIDGVFREHLEATGMGYDREVALIRAAARAGLLTTPYVFGPEQAAAMAEAGADAIVCHLGLTVGGSVGARHADSLEESVRSIDIWAAAARAVRPDILVLCHGGPVAEPEDLAYVLRTAKEEVHGFYGASAMERLPVEQAITGRVRAFTGLSAGADRRGTA